MIERERVQKILRYLEPHSPSWINEIRVYIAKLEFRLSAEGKPLQKE